MMGRGTNQFTNMADECMVEFLHSEVVKYVADVSEEKGDISTLEYLGYITGFRIIERLTKEWPPFKNELDTMKFLCTDFWASIYKKQIDNLRTNHHGVYVLQDNAFRYLIRLSSQKQYLEVAPKFVAFTCGLVRGALANLGITCLVTAEVDQMPACKFHIQTIMKVEELLLGLKVAASSLTHAAHTCFATVLLNYETLGTD